MKIKLNVRNDDHHVQIMSEFFDVREVFEDYQNNLLCILWWDRSTDMYQLTQYPSDTVRGYQIEHEEVS